MTTRPAIIPVGVWPARMSPALAAGYCGEPSVESFLRRVGTGTRSPWSTRDGASYG